MWLPPTESPTNGKSIFKYFPQYLLVRLKITRDFKSEMVSISIQFL